MDMVNLVLLGCAVTALAAEPPAITPAPRLGHRQDDPAFVEFVGNSSDARSCDFPQTVSTSDDYVQCCPTTGACPFFTTCSSNTLLAANATVPCDVDPGLACNTGLVGSASYLACWQTSLGSEAFTIAQTAGSGGQASNSASATGSQSSDSESETSSASASTSETESTASSTAATSSRASGESASSASGTSSSAAAGLSSAQMSCVGGVVGAVIVAAQLLM